MFPPSPTGSSSPTGSAGLGPDVTGPDVTEPYGLGPGLGPDESVPVDPLMQVVPDVDALADLTADHWAYKYVKTLNERYNFLTGDMAGRFRGNEPLSRDEFVAVMNKVLRRIEVFRDEEREEMNALKRLIASYRAAEKELRTRMDGLEERETVLTRQNFSPTTKLTTQIVQTLSDGTGARTTGLSRIRLNLKSSFTGADQLVTQLEFGNNGGDAIALAEAKRGGQLNALLGFSGGTGLVEVGVPPVGQLRKLYYQFPLGDRLNVTVGSNLPPSDFIDHNRFANRSGSNYSSSFFSNNPLIVQNDLDRNGGAGAAVNWAISKKITVRTLYVAAAGSEVQSLPGVRRGLLGDQRQGTIEAEFQPNAAMAWRLQYTNAVVNNSVVNAIGLNGEWAISREIGVFGRLGWGHYQGFNQRLLREVDVSPLSWMTGVTVGNFLITGSKAGLAIGQPFVSSGLGSATQTNVETYFSFMLNDRINLIPSLQVVANPDNRPGKTVLQWAFRAVVDF
jgi:BMFP domain-containing protein YqiC